VLSNGYTTFVSCYTFCSEVIAINFVDIDHLFKRCSNCELQAVVFIGVVVRVIRYVYCYYATVSFSYNGLLYVFICLLLYLFHIHYDLHD